MLRSNRLIINATRAKQYSNVLSTRDITIGTFYNDLGVVLARHTKWNDVTRRRPVNSAPLTAAGTGGSPRGKKDDKDDKEKKLKEMMELMKRIQSGKATSEDSKKLEKLYQKHGPHSEAESLRKLRLALTKVTRDEETPSDLKEIRNALLRSTVDKPMRRKLFMYFYDNYIDKASNYKKATKSDEKEEKKEEKEGKEEEQAEKSEEQKQEDNKNDIKERLKRALAVTLFFYGLLVLIRGASSPENVNVKDVTWSDFKNKLLPTGQVSKIRVFPEKELAYVYLYQNSKGLDGIPLEPTYRLQIPSLARFEREVRAVEDAVGLPPEHWTQIEFTRLEGINNLLVTGVLLAIGFGIYYMVKKSNFKMSAQSFAPFSKAKINIIDPKAPEGKSKLKIKFKDVAGLHEAKVEISEFVDYLKNPQKYTKLGAKLPKGAILTGPPGCGKTLLAKALAAESSAPFISMNGTEFIEMIGGLGASRIRDLFKEAKRRSPCIIYIDEIDAIGKKRSEGRGGYGGGNGEEEQTLNQLLVEMDGMDTNQGVILIASTNRPDILDKALMRPGRFDRHISVDLPTIIERKELFDLYVKKIKLNQNHPEHLTQRLAQMTPGFSGADIANVVNEAAIHAATDLHKQVEVTDLDFALQKIIAGPEKRSKVLVQEEREVVAWHESGHALVGWLLEHTDALLKVTIIPRTSAALGFAQYNPRDKKLFGKDELFDRMCMMLGGRAAENITFGRCTTGAQNDLEKVTQQAYAQIKRYGFSSIVGPLSFASEPGQERAEQFQRKPYSKHLGNVMDSEARTLVKDAYLATEQLLRQNQSKLDLLAKTLLERETLSYEDVKQLIGPPKYGEKNVVDLADMVLPKDD
ncbi:unnamed protein product [Bursaphelenchus okinawaensis]|uniref:AAA+ ATPase domain-containing protein n=1 Tax=Bursaphelenchus okinawaensis TaxID=465554 RepID=A0A811KSR2_9BILA|nr:unnamed protein product [Bursaphelenchus okinawaensis]CAG9109992.1 unnamed protein product [Bursaphelenchus okinawaensis]